MKNINHSFVSNLSLRYSTSVAYVIERIRNKRILKNQKVNSFLVATEIAKTNEASITTIVPISLAVVLIVLIIYLIRKKKRPLKSTSEIFRSDNI